MEELVVLSANSRNEAYLWLVIFETQVDMWTDLHVRSEFTDLKAIF